MCASVHTLECNLAPTRTPTHPPDLPPPPPTLHPEVTRPSSGSVYRTYLLLEAHLEGLGLGSSQPLKISFPQIWCCRWKILHYMSDLPPPRWTRPKELCPTNDSETRTASCAVVPGCEETTRCSLRARHMHLLPNLARAAGAKRYAETAYSRHGAQRCSFQLSACVYCHLPTRSVRTHPGAACSCCCLVTG